MKTLVYKIKSQHRQLRKLVKQGHLNSRSKLPASVSTGLSKKILYSHGSNSMRDKLYTKDKYYYSPHWYDHAFKRATTDSHSEKNAVNNNKFRYLRIWKYYKQLNKRPGSNSRPSCNLFQIIKIIC